MHSEWQHGMLDCANFQPEVSFIIRGGCNCNARWVGAEIYRLPRVVVSRKQNAKLRHRGLVAGKQTFTSVRNVPEPETDERLLAGSVITGLLRRLRHAVQDCSGVPECSGRRTLFKNLKRAPKITVRNRLIFRSPCSRLYFYEAVIVRKGYDISSRNQ